MKTSFYNVYKLQADQIWEKINQDGLPKTRCGTKLVKIILLNRPTDLSFINGVAVTFKKKSLGCGVYEVWMEAV
jgi:hypothetical protein